MSSQHYDLIIIWVQFSLVGFVVDVLSAKAGWKRQTCHCNYIYKRIVMVAFILRPHVIHWPISGVKFGTLHMSPHK